MINENCWRQPIPTDIRQCQSLTTLDRLVFFEILTLCQNEDYLCHFLHNNKQYSVELKRGECIFKVAQFAKDLNFARCKIRKSLENISKWYSGMNIKAKPYGLILSLKFYDDLVKMNSKDDNTATVEQQQRDSRATPNKSDKTVKSEKEHKETIHDFSSEPDTGNPSHTMQGQGGLQTGTSGASELPMEILEEFNSLTGKKFRMTPEKRKQITERLKTFTREDIVQAIKNRLSDPSCMGRNKTGTVWAHDWNSLFRNNENMDRAFQLQVLKDDKFYEREMEELDFLKFKDKYGKELALKYYISN